MAKLCEHNFDTGSCGECYIDKIESQLLASQAQIAQLRGVLEELENRDWDWDMMGGNHGMKKLQEYRGRVFEILSQTKEPPLLEVVREMKDALYWLVWLKDWKESEGKTPEYLRRNPLIWEQARSALNRAKELLG